MSDVKETLDDIHKALRSVIEASRKQFAMIATTQIAVLSVIEQLAGSSLIDAALAADRMREMITEILTANTDGLGKDVSIFADRIAKFAPAETPSAPQPPKGTKPKLVQ
ncbi:MULTISPECIES: hypothetical protein [unclassified Rhizobium]|uniref:hypothetical protein n=1 Tax=unclassified Rhizobium TaxID=2613769 RepID=UPI001ADBB473|nr:MULTISPECIES: hypothetical protein [unclassified Rhizobium]MBO9101202.1 hypothetical protein [Rhizobium sp. L58/93]MBO9136299.1 hypothetical protein [Rhizobium sp. B209b/85]MBO9170851.1 hypothetical protein [Rhizobium sp. L245/93]MBO9186768.1 hypothetical protein [Rhizobium sp. E27B/91]QXZ86201.1 hypothetical protein J5287_24305 [Rhizobium sp. K1/93]